MPSIETHNRAAIHEMVKASNNDAHTDTDIDSQGCRQPHCSFGQMTNPATFVVVVCSHMGPTGTA